MLRSVLTIILVAVSVASTPARAAGGDDDDEKTGNDLVKVRVLADRTPVHGGERFHLVFVFTIDPHWHIYWKSAGDSGWPTEIKVTAPDGFEVGEILFPRPSTFSDGIGTTYGYERQCVLFVPVTAPPVLGEGEAVFSARVDWTVCKSVCRFGGADLTLAVPASAADAPGDAAKAPAAPGDPVIAAAVAQLPRPLRELPGAAGSFDRASATLRLTGPASDGVAPGFLPVDRPGIRFDAATSRVRDGRFELTVPVTLDPPRIEGTSPALEGLLILGSGRDDPSYDVRIMLP